MSNARMPWTFAHPAAVLPLRRLGPLRLDCTALVIGSIAPDLPYYVHAFALSTLAHTFAGSLVVCVPLGAVVLFAFDRLRPALIALLPQPQRGLLPMDPPSRGWRVVCVSLWLGALTHCVWDGFTHRTGWAVAELPWLRLRPWHAVDLPLYGLLQHASTLLGVGVLALAYRRWHVRQHAMVRTRSDRWRCALWIAAAMTATIVSAAIQWTGGMQRVTVFRFVVDATSVFFAFVAVCAIGVRTPQRRSMR